MLARSFEGFGQGVVDVFEFDGGEVVDSSENHSGQASGMARFRHLQGDRPKDSSVLRRTSRAAA